MFRLFSGSAQASRSLTLGLLMLTWASAAQAQVVPPGNASPGAIIQSIEKETPVQKPPEIDKPVQAPSIQGGEKLTPGSTQPPDTANSVVFHVRKIEIEGIQHLDPAVVKALVPAYENRDGNLSDFLALADKLTKLYQEKGYVTSYVYIPPQKLDEGVLKLKAVEGTIDSLKIDEGQFFKKPAFLGRIELSKGEIFNVNTLQRNLTNLNDNPDMKVQAALKPGEVQGQTIVEVKTKDQLPIHISGFYDNLGRRLIGNNRLGVTFSHNNMLGLGDSAYSSSAFSKHSYSLLNHYSIPVGGNGTAIRFDNALSNSRLGKELYSSKINGHAVIYSPSIVRTLVNNKRFKLTHDLAFDFMQLGTNLHNSALFRDQLRVLRPGFNLTEYDKHGTTQMRHEFGIGLGILGGTSGSQHNASRAGAGSKFFRYTGSLVRTQRLPWSTYGILRANVQLTPDRLVSAQQIQVGGAYTVRGYSQGRLIGDSGYVLSGEWRVPCFMIPKTWKLPNTEYGLRDNMQMVAFADLGEVFTNKATAGIKNHAFALGVGTGIRAQLTKNLVGRVDIGIPLIRLAPDRQTPRLHFGLQNALF